MRAFVVRSIVFAVLLMATGGMAMAQVIPADVYGVTATGEWSYGWDDWVADSCFGGVDTVADKEFIEELLSDGWVDPDHSGCSGAPPVVGIYNWDAVEDEPSDVCLEFDFGEDALVDGFSLINTRMNNGDTLLTFEYWDGSWVEMLSDTASNVGLTDNGSGVTTEVDLGDGETSDRFRFCMFGDQAGGSQIALHEFRLFGDGGRAVPTLSQWAMMAMALLLLASGVMALRRMRVLRAGA